MAGVLGGTQSLHTNSMDETLALPTEHAVKLALRTQQVLADETGVTRTVDPLGGSYFIEALTDEIERRALDIIDHVYDNYGGVLPATEQGYFRRSIGDSSHKFGQEFDAGERIMVGVNKYSDDDHPPARHAGDRQECGGGAGRAFDGAESSPRLDAPRRGVEKAARGSCRC